MSEERKGFDRELVKDFNFELEFDEQKMQAFLEKAKMPLDLVPEQALHEIGCGKLVDGQFVINNAGVLFFAKRSERFVKENYVTCIKYKGESVMHMIDRKAIYGDLVSLVDETEKFVKMHTRIASKFEGFTRIDIEEYPYLAVREAIVNAVCHRDYSIENNIFVNIFDNRVEVISPGSIPNNLTLQEVWGKSNPRNRTIVDLFHQLGERYVEKAGTGLKRMEEEMILKGLRKPTYESNKAFFTVTFFGPGDKIFDLVKPSNKIDLRKLGLNERQLRLLNFLSKEQKKISSKQYCEMFNVGRNTANLDLTKLIKLQFIQSEGKAKATHYFLR